MSLTKDHPDLKNYRCIFKYITGKHGQRIGVILGCVKNNEKVFNIGWSLRDRKDPVRFDNDKALKIAFGRAVKGSNVPLPHSIEIEYLRFSDRCFKYFKGCVMDGQLDK